MWVDPGPEAWLFPARSAGKVLEILSGSPILGSPRWGQALGWVGGGPPSLLLGGLKQPDWIEEPFETETFKKSTNELSECGGVSGDSCQQPPCMHSPNEEGTNGNEAGELSDGFLRPFPTGREFFFWRWDHPALEWQRMLHFGGIRCAFFCCRCFCIFFFDAQTTSPCEGSAVLHKLWHVRNVSLTQGSMGSFGRGL